MRALLPCVCVLLTAVHWVAATVSMQWQQFPLNGPSPSPRAYVFEIASHQIVRFFCFFKYFVFKSMSRFRSGTFDPVSNRYFVYGGGAGPAGVSSSFNDLVRVSLSSV
jgi:hypothetical protein